MRNITIIVIGGLLIAFALLFIGGPLLKRYYYVPDVPLAIRPISPKQLIPNITAPAPPIMPVHREERPAITSALTFRNYFRGWDAINVAYQITATNQPTEYRAENLPPGVLLDRLSGLIKGTPHDPGSWKSVITAINSAGADTKTVEFTLVGVKLISLVANGYLDGDGSLSCMAVDPDTNKGVDGIPIVFKATKGKHRYVAKKGDQPVSEIMIYTGNDGVAKAYVVP